MDQILSYDKSKDKDYYELLGCDPSSTEEQIQAEYRVLALKLHPDKNTENPEADELFQKLQAAKNTLTDPEKRAAYDKWRASGMTISFEQWSGMAEHMSPMMHWATPQTKDRMVDLPGSSTKGLKATDPKDLHQQRRASEVIRPNRPQEGWERDSSDILKKFRNYEI